MAALKLPVIQLPMGKPPTDAELIKATVVDVRQWTKDAQRQALGYALKIGGALIELRERCKRNGEKFGDFFPKNDAERDDPRKLPFVWDTGNRLMKIAENKAITHSEHARNALPADWTSLYTLARIPAPKLSRLIQHKEVSADLTRAEASKLAKEHAPAKPARAAPPPPKPGAVDRAIRKTAAASAPMPQPTFKSDAPLDQPLLWELEHVISKFRKANPGVGNDLICATINRLYWITERGEVA